jgi:hypothetical protein
MLSAAQRPLRVGRDPNQRRRFDLGEPASDLRLNHGDDLRQLAARRRACRTDRQVMNVVPIAKVDPDAGAQSTGVGPSTMSFADALKRAATPRDAAASPAMSAGTVIACGVLSTTVIANVRDA